MGRRVALQGLYPSLPPPGGCDLGHLWELITELGSEELPLVLRENYKVKAPTRP